MNIDQFKCLVFVSGLKGHAYADTRPRLLSRIRCETAEAPVNLQTLINEYQRLVNLKKNTSMIESQSSSKQAVHTVQEKGSFHHPHTSKTEASTEKTARGRCFVTTTANLNLLGIEWIELFKLWSVPLDSVCNQVKTKSIDQQINEFRAKHAYVFNDSLGHCRKLKVKLFLKPNAKPIFCPKRPVPFNTIRLVDAELTRLQSLGILEPVDFSEWAAPIVAVRKPNGRVHICADYSTGLNEALEPNHYPLPTSEEIFAQLNGSTVFNIVDLSDAYLQLEVDDDSKKRLTINTHRGLFRFNRLAPGVKSAPGVFQRVVDGMIADIPGVRSFIDDVIVFGKDISSHATSLNLLFLRFKEYGFHVKAEECHLPRFVTTPRK
uniref:uncharacterized protein K02A2.6-like n=1 Tax=Anopheles coluzzii TaxID=1518534 RepID=UPI0020FF8FAB|nr:uncharacterized protein K02A2.6-like [Anopheles coluzzii]